MFPPFRVVWWYSRLSTPSSRVPIPCAADLFTPSNESQKIHDPTGVRPPERDGLTGVDCREKHKTERNLALEWKRARALPMKPNRVISQSRRHTPCAVTLGGRTRTWPLTPIR